MRRFALSLGAFLLALAAALHVAGLLGGEGRGDPTASSAREHTETSEQDPVLLAAPGPRSGPGAAARPNSDPAAPGVHAGPLTRREGQVYDEQGQPLAGASVRALDAPASTAEALTDADGRFALALPPPGNFALSVSAPGRAEITLDAVALEGPLVIALGTTPTLAGVVLDEATEAPVAGVLLTARPATSPAAPRGSTAWSRDDGRFTLALPAAGAFALEVGGAGFAGRPGTEDYLPRVLLDVEAGRGDLRILLTRGLTIEGRVFHSPGSSPKIWSFCFGMTIDT